MSGKRWTKLCTLSRLRMRKGQWLIDVKDYTGGKPKEKTITIGKRLVWQKISEKIPSACFNKTVESILLEGIKGVTFVKILQKYTDLDRAHGLLIPFNDEEGNLLINIDTGNPMVNDIKP